MQKTKIVITGSNGLLGQYLVKLFSENKKFEVYAFSKGKNRITKSNDFNYFNVNMTNKLRLDILIKKIKPHFIINGAAMTNVDACELRKRECLAINVEAVRNLASCCKKHNSHLIQISTDFIFDGKKGMYTEDDMPNPINYYGESKLKAEEILQKSTINFTILRTILVYGKVENMTRGNIVLWVKNELENNKGINVINDQYRMPTYAGDLAEACALVVQKNQNLESKNQIKAIYNISSSELLSIYEIANQIAETFELDKKLIKETTTKQLNQKAKRPPKTGFVLDKAATELGFKKGSFKERLAYYKKTLVA